VARFVLGNRLGKAADRSSALQRALWLLEAGVFRGFLAMLRRLPVERATAIGRRIATRIGPGLPKHGKILRNLELAFPEKTPAEREELARRIWGGVGALLVEYAHLDHICLGPDGGRLETVVAGNVRAFGENGRPAIFVAAHLANWELCAAALMRHTSVTAVYTPLQNPYLDALLARCREPLGCRLLPRDESMRGLIRELAAGRSIGLVMDQRVDSGKPVPMFGIEKLTTLVPARLALRHDCDLVPLRTERLGDARYRVTIYPPITADDPDAPESEQALQMTRKINATFEDWIRKRPADWFCAKRRWPKDAVPAMKSPAL
jgi:KDO2-lipid IV(A) lauroyltransferase